MELLGKIFGNPDRVKIMRLFLWNEGVPYTIDDVIRRARIRKDKARLELSALSSVGFLDNKNWIEKVPTKPTKAKPKGGTKRVAKKGWILSKKFELVEPLRTLLIDTELVQSSEIVKRMKLSGKVELLILSGVFLRDENRKVDLLIVGDKLAPSVISKQVAILESEIGRELSYAHFDIPEFKYRLGMYDKLLRDVLENDHTTLVNKLGV